MPEIKNILVVCTGNSCRSPIAEGFLKEYLRPEDGFEVISAGTSAAMRGFNPAQEAAEVMKEEGIDISFYLTKPLSEELVKSADIILAMADVHKEFILGRWPEVKDKTHLFKEFAETGDYDMNVIDPIGQPISVYRSVREDIRRASAEIARKIKQDRG